MIEFTELGHNILHGSYDDIPDCGIFHSAKWKWDHPIDEFDWQTSHHQNHHPYVNIVDQDHDLGLFLFRSTEKQKWTGNLSARKQNQNRCFSTNSSAGMDSRDIR